jgi:hypothetical protein
MRSLNGSRPDTHQEVARNTEAHAITAGPNFALRTPLDRRTGSKYIQP